LGLSRIIEKKRKGKGRKMTLDEELSALTTEVTNLQTVDESARVLINGIAGQIAAAVTVALAAGATTAQLSTLTQLTDAIRTQNTSLAAAVAQNTPAPAP
jgi:hypothetical protein